MTDKEIIKLVYGCVIDNTCNGCPYNNRWYWEAECKGELLRDLFEVTNRLQAENERLHEAIHQGCITTEIQMRAENHYQRQQLERIEKAKAEAIKEFAERLKEKLSDCRTVNDFVYTGYDTGDTLNSIDNLVKEMVGDSKSEKEREQ